MKFSYPSDVQFFITSNFKQNISATIVDIHIYKDSWNSILCLKKDEFIGVFDSIEELNIKMGGMGFSNFDSFPEFKNPNLYLFAKDLVKKIETLKEVNFEMVNRHPLLTKICDEDYKREKDIEESIKRCEKDFFEFLLDSGNSKSKLSEDRYLKIDLSHWKHKEKRLLFLNILRGVYYYYSSHTKKRDFDSKTYKSLKKAMDGENLVEIYEESIKWFADNIKEKLKSENYQFPDKERFAQYLYEPRESFNDTYYNDQLDMDQQDPEFWDSL